MSSNLKSKAKEKTVHPMEHVKANGKVLCQKFERQGFAAVRAVNGTEALDKMKQECFDLILLDLFMPGKDGFAVLQERVDGKCANTPVFVLTNLGEEDILKRAKSIGANECFTKSNTSLNDLVNKVKERLGL